MADNGPPGGDDYDNWTWKQIETAILGGVDMTLDKQAELTGATSSPQTFNDAADIYKGLRQDLQTLHDNVQTWSNQSIGVEGGWRGKGADAFKEMIGTLLDRVQALIEVIAGPRSYMNALTESGTALGTCMREVADADHDGAQATIDRYNHDSALTPFPGPAPWRKDGGTTIVAVSTYPDIVEEMTRKMRESIKKLAQAYQATIGDLRDPEDPEFAQPTGADPEPAPIDTNAPPMDGTIPLPVPGKTPLVNRGALPGEPPAAQPAPPGGGGETPPPPPTPPSPPAPGTGVPVPAMDLTVPATVEAPPALPDGENLFIGQPPPRQPAPQVPGLTFPAGGQHAVDTPDLRQPNLVGPGYDPSTHLAGLGNMAFTGFAPGVSSPDSGHFLLPNTGNDFLLARPAPITGPITTGAGPFASPMAPLVGGGYRSYGALRSGFMPEPSQPGPDAGASPGSPLNDFVAPNTPVHPNFITTSTGPGAGPGTGPGTGPVPDGGGGAPMAPGMIGRRSEEEDHDAASWLVERDDEWDGGMPNNPSFLSRSER
ncbi:MAG: WXG100 family type VII secretion target [Catenulispora sp.]